MSLVYFPCVILAFLLLLLITHVSSLYTWRNMTSEEYKNWYTHHEIRHLEDDNQKDENLNHIPFSWYCSHPHLSTHPHFKMGLEGYSDINDNKLRPLLESLWPDTNNVTLIFIGDSLTGKILFFFVSLSLQHKI